MTGRNGFTEPAEMGQAIIGDIGDLNEGQTTYLGETSTYVPPPIPQQQPYMQAPAPVAQPQSQYYQPQYAMQGQFNPNHYWNEQGVLMDRATGLPVPNATPAPTATDDKPKAHLIETSDRFIILIDIPGSPKEAVSVNFDEPTIKVDIVRPNPIDELKEIYGDLRDETQVAYKTWHLSYKMIKNIDSVSATIDNGVLRIDAVFKAKAQETKINIK